MESSCMTGQIDKMVHLFIEKVCNQDVYVCAGLLFGICVLRVLAKRNK